MLTKGQIRYLEVNRAYPLLIVGTRALVDNGLMYGPCTLDIYESNPRCHDIHFGDVTLEHYHFHDGYFCTEIYPEYNLWLPSAERAIVDTITFLDKNYIEGPLIESLQTYLGEHEDLSELRKVADFYKLPQETLDYWIKEAQENGPMSMG